MTDHQGRSIRFKKDPKKVKEFVLAARRTVASKSMRTPDGLSVSET
jgi:hypothetical protein